MVKAEKRSSLLTWTLAAGTAIIMQKAAVTLVDPVIGNTAIFLSSYFILGRCIFSLMKNPYSCPSAETTETLNHQTKKKARVITNIEKVAICACLYSSWFASKDLSEILAKTFKLEPPPIEERHKRSIRPAPLIVVPTPPSVIKL